MTKSSFSFIPDNFLNDAMIQQFLIFACYVTAIALVPVAFAEYDSPKKQMEMGYPPYAVMCNEGKVLAIRDGSALCLTEKSAQRLGLQIISDYQVENSRALIQTSESQKQYKELIKEATKDKTEPKNYPVVPLENPEEFKEKFISTLNKALTLVKDGKYVSENGFYEHGSGYFENDDFTFENEQDIGSFLIHTMDLMGFNHTGSKVSEQFHPKSSRAILSHEYGTVTVNARSPGCMGGCQVDNVQFVFSGWYEDRKSLTPKLSGQEAKKIGIDYFDRFVEKHGFEFNRSQKFTIEDSDSQVYTIASIDKEIVESYDSKIHGIDRNDKFEKKLEHVIEYNHESLKDRIPSYRLDKNGMPYYVIHIGIFYIENIWTYMDMDTKKFVEVKSNTYEHPPRITVFMNGNGENVYIDT